MRACLLIPSSIHCGMGSVESTTECCTTPSQGQPPPLWPTRHTTENLRRGGFTPASPPPLNCHSSLLLACPGVTASLSSWQPWEQQGRAMPQQCGIAEQPKTCACCWDRPLGYACHLYMPHPMHVPPISVAPSRREAGWTVGGTVVVAVPACQHGPPPTWAPPA